MFPQTLKEDITNWNEYLFVSCFHSQCAVSFFKSLLRPGCRDAPITTVGYAFLIRIIMNPWLDEELSLHLRACSAWLCADASDVKRIRGNDLTGTYCQGPLTSLWCG